VVPAPTDVGELPRQLLLDRVSESTFRVEADGERAAKGYVLFGGQILAQMIMAGSADSDKVVQSLQVVFARAGSYEQPIEYVVEAMHHGRSFASTTVTCRQGDRLLARGLLLLSSPDHDLIRHQSVTSDLSRPDQPGEPDGRLFPGSVAVVTRPGPSPSALAVWSRHEGSIPSTVGNQAALAWGTDGYLIAAALGPHPEFDESQAHGALSTGVVSHSISFHRPVNVSEWLVMAHDGRYAGGGRAFGSCSVFTEDGELVASFSQDAMVRSHPGHGSL
jgi:acyl-CoA thioesterase II